MEVEVIRKGLKEFTVGDSATHFAFIKRLAKENAWSIPFAEDAVEEYRRFLFLGITTDEVVTPSEIVDQVWHLHLLYTESYWNDLCGRVLQRSFHHGPSRGTHAEDRTFGLAYEDTLRRYRATFGPPPANFWPVGPQPKTHYQRIDLLAFKRALRSRYLMVSALSFVAGALAVGACFLWN